VMTLGFGLALGFLLGHLFWAQAPKPPRLFK
jgi:hypothetical protein